MYWGVVLKGFGFKRALLGSVLLAAGLGPVATSSAAVFLDVDGAFPIAISDSGAVASRFTVGPSDYQLSSIAAPLRLVVAGQDTLSLEIYQETLGQPGNTLVGGGTTVVNNFAGFQEHSVAATGTLEAGQAYWLVIRVTAGTVDFVVDRNNTAADTSGATPTFQTFVSAVNDPSGWNGTFVLGDAGFNNGTRSLAYSLSGVAVPELPETGAVLGLGGAAVAIWLRRRQRDGSQGNA